MGLSELRLGAILLFVCAWMVCCEGATYCQGLQNVNALTGTIEDPIGGRNYQDLKTCKWSITSPVPASWMTVTWNRFDLEYAYDFLDIKSSSNYNGRWTGYVRPQNLSVPVTSGNPVVIIFTADQLVTFTGFSLTFTFVNCSNTCVNGYCNNGACQCYGGWKGASCEIAYCPNNCNNNGYCNGGKCSCNSGFTGPECLDRNPVYCTGTAEMDSSSGNFSDHTPWYIPYQDSSNCRWIIRTGSPGAVSVVTALHQFQWYTDILNVFDGDEQDAPLLAQISQSGFASGPVVTARNTGNIAVTFTSDPSESYTGFTALFSRNDLCPNNCSGNGYCIESRCVCVAGMTGNDCSQNYFPKPIKYNSTITGQLNDFEWHYFSLNLNIPDGQKLDKLTLRFAKLDDLPPNSFSSHWKWGGGDISFFIAFDYLPNLVTYHYEVPYWIIPQEMDIYNPNSGTWYIGVYAKEAASYSFTMDVPYFLNDTDPTDYFTNSPEGSKYTPQSSRTSNISLILGIVVAILSLGVILSIAGTFYYFKLRGSSPNDFQRVHEQGQDNQLVIE